MLIIVKVRHHSQGKGSTIKYELKNWHRFNVWDVELEFYCHEEDFN